MAHPLLPFYRWFRQFFFDPLLTARTWRALPVYLRNRAAWRRLNTDPRFRPLWCDSHFCTTDRTEAAGAAHGHYFWQDLWAADELRRRGVREHVDVASRLDGFVAHVLPWCRLTYVDIRPLELQHPNFLFSSGSILALPFSDCSVPSLSCLHVIEHIGLGRYGDPIDPYGHLLAARELARVLAPGGYLLVGTPVGKERVCFDAHRVFDPDTIVSAFAPLELCEFHLIVDDNAVGVRRDASFSDARACSYGCGLFLFTRKSP